MDVELFADPSCPWSWAAYLWLDEVAPHRQLRVRMQPFSLLLRDDTSGLSPVLRTARVQAHRALRVAAVISAGEARNAFYAAVSGAAYAAVAAGERPLFGIAAALRAAGLDPELATRADDATLDAGIGAGMRALSGLFPGVEPEKQRIPVIVLHGAGGPLACHGPLLDPPPRGREAVQVWDATEQLLQIPGMYELSRARPARHSLLSSAITG